MTCPRSKSLKVSQDAYVWHLVSVVRHFCCISDGRILDFFLYPLILSLTGSYRFSWVMGYLWVTTPIFIDTLLKIFDLSFVFLRVISTFVHFSCLTPCSIKSKVKNKIAPLKEPVMVTSYFPFKTLDWSPWNTEAGIKLGFDLCYLLWVFMLVYRACLELMAMNSLESFNVHISVAYSGSAMVLEVHWGNKFFLD